MNKEILKKIAIAGESLNYCLSFSYVLKHLGLISSANDIDIIIDIKDFDIFLSRLDYDKIKEVPKSLVYKSEKFVTIVIDNISMDIMSNYTINNKVNYTYVLESERINEYIITSKGKIPIIPLEDLCYLYKIMPRKNNNYEILSEFLKNEYIEAK